MAADDDDAGVIDALDFAQPRCPRCQVLMRPAGEGDECPSCGHREPWVDATHPGREAPGIGYLGY